MTPENFVYWLQGFFEINGTGAITSSQAHVISDNLKLVLNKVTADRAPTIDVWATPDGETPKESEADKTKKFEESVEAAIKEGVEGAKAFAKIARGMMSVDNRGYCSNKPAR